MIRAIPYLVYLALIFMISCNKDEVPEIIQTDGLKLIIQNKSESLPAKVSIFFKVETKEGLPVAGMQEKDFTIFENKNRISIDEAARKISPRAQKFGYSTLLILDLSGSVTNSYLPQLKEASKAFINAIIPTGSDGAVRIGISWFDGENKLHQLIDFTNNKTQLVAALESITKDISQDNSTDLYGAVIKGVDKINNVALQFTNDDLSHAAAMVVFTDGTDQAARFTRDQAINTVKGANKEVTFYSIGLGSEIDTESLKSIGKNGFELAQNTERLIATFNKIASKISDDANSYYLFEYCSPKRNGEHEVTIEGTYQNLRGSVSTKFNARDFTGGCRL